MAIVKFYIRETLTINKKSENKTALLTAGIIIDQLSSPVGLLSGYFEIFEPIKT